jgi:hypothetical protein
MITVPVKVTIIDIDETRDTHIYGGTGVYYGDGRIVFTATVPEGKIEYEIDPERFNEEDPKRCIRVDNNKWSRYRLRSSLVDSRVFLKMQKSCAKV